MSNYPNTVADVASEILSDLDDVDGLSLTYVASWLRSNIGKLNVGAGVCITISEDLEFDPVLDDDLKVLFKQSFLCHYYKNKAMSNLGASSFDWVALDEGDTKLKRISRNDVAKTFMAIAKECTAELDKMLKFYRTNKALPTSLSAYGTFAWQYCRQDDPHN